MQCCPRTVLFGFMLTLCCCILIFYHLGDPLNEGRLNSGPPKIWASIGVCWGENFKGYGKGNFPYARAAVYSSRLWDNQTKSQVTAVVTIVNPFDSNPKELLDYVKELEGWGANVVIQPSMWKNCPQQSQVVRMFAFLYPFIKPEDIVITADADTYIIGDSVMNMLRVPSRVWVGEYVHTARTGGSIPMALVGMKAKQWKENLDFSNRGINTGMKEMVKTFLEIDGGKGWGGWEVDQIILSNAILRPDKQLCPLARTNSLWKRLKLEPTEMEKKETCFQGDLMNCHRGNKRKYCPWWHFLPSDREDYLKQVFMDITVRGRVSGQPPP